MPTPALGVLSFRFFIGATSYLTNINSFAGLRLLPNQNDVDLVLRIFSHCAAEASDICSVMIGLRAPPRSIGVEAADPEFTFSGGPKCSFFLSKCNIYFGYASLLVY